jgi:hypothetical protein
MSQDETVHDRDIGGSGEMNLWNVTSHHTTSEAQDVATARSRPEDGASSRRPGDLDLDLLEVMRDLDPGMLAWTPTADGDWSAA